MNKPVSQFAVRTLSLSLAFSLVAAIGPARCEGDSISNNSVPLPPPSSTGLVKKIWSTLDPRKLKGARTSTTDKKAAPSQTASTGSGNEKEVQKASAPPTTTASPTTASTTNTQQSQAPQTSDVNQINTTKETTTAKADSKAAEGSTWDWSGEVGTTTDTTTQTEKVAESPSAVPEQKKTDSTTEIALSPVATPVPAPAAPKALEVVSTETKPASAANIPSTPTPNVEAPSTTEVKPATESKPMFAAETPATTDSGSKPAFTVGSSGRITLASQVLALPPGSVLGTTPQLQTGDTQVVDSDEAEEVQETIKYEDLPTDESKTKVKAGAKFPIVISSQLTSRTAKKGDPLQGRLKFDLKIADRVIAKKGSVVNGHITYVLKARTILRSLVSKERWYRNSGTLGLAFDEIISEKGEHIPLHAQPARAARIVQNKAEGRELGVNHLGQVTGPWGPQLRHKALRIGMNFALAPAGVFSFGAMPVALGVIGAVNPNFAFSKPVGLNVRHRRLKGFAWGFLSGVPGSWLIEDTTVRGQEAIIKPGDEFYAEFVDEFTGEQATDAQLMPGASTKIRGQVLTDPKKKKTSPKK